MPYDSRLLLVYQRDALDVSFDGNVILIRESGDSRQGLPPQKGGVQGVRLLMRAEFSSKLAFQQD